MKKFLTVILALVMLVVSVPFAVSAEDVSPMALRCICPTPSNVNDYEDLGNGKHAVICLYCGLQIRAESHSLVYGESCGDIPEYCIVCDYAADYVPHIKDVIVMIGHDGHEVYCSREGCNHNYMPDCEEDCETPLYFEQHWTNYTPTYTMEYYSGEYWHGVTWECDVCEYEYYGEHYCNNQSPDCQGGCFNPEW